MELPDETLESLWRTARTLWFKYCGISDEYKMLRDRWLYLYEEEKLTVLPHLRRSDKGKEKKTFDLLDDHTKVLEEEFEKIGFKRSKIEDISDFKAQVKAMSTDELLDRLKLIEELFYDHSNFVGLLKAAFFQRTVSAEIAHVISALPHSPERTIGNELFYLAADNVARRYCDCLNIPYGKWDDFITFIPPIEEGSFYGGFYNPSSYLKLFHVSLSEEAKYFVGSYFTLAHELGHAIMLVISETGVIKKIDYPDWFKIFTADICYRTVKHLETNEQSYCSYCQIYLALKGDVKADQYQRLLSKYRYYSEELLADIIAYYIAGENYLFEFVDAFYQRVSTRNLAFLLRVVSTYAYLESIKKDISGLKINIDNIIKDYENNNLKYLAKLCEGKISEEKYKCPLFPLCIIQICAIWANAIKELDKNVAKYVGKKSGISLDQYPDFHDGFFKSIISEEFRIKDEENAKLKDALLNGVPIPDEDPRHIMHSYYEVYKESKGERRPHYASTIYSLAFNSYMRNIKQRE